MKKIYSTILITFLIIGCSKNDTINEVIEEEIVNQPPTNFDISVNNISDYSATVDWSSAIDPDGDVVKYTIYLNGNIISDNLTEISYDISGLTELTNYSGKIVAKDSYNNETEKSFSFTTLKNYLKYSNIFDFENNPGGDTYSMINTNAGNYVIVGSEPRADFNGAQLFVLKINYDGDKIWKKYFDFNIGDARTFKFIQSSDNGFVFVAKNYVIKADVDGNLIWHREIISYNTGEGSAEIKSVEEDSNGFLYVIGGRGSIINLEKTQEAVLTKLDSNGNILWEKIYGTSVRSFFNDIIITQSSDILILGSAETSGLTIDELNNGEPEQIDFWIIKTNLNGDIEWSKTYGDGRYDFPEQLIKTNDNNFVFVGYSWGAYDISNARLFKIDINGNGIWDSNYNTNNLSMYSVVETVDGGFSTAGYHFGNSNSLVILKYDYLGNVVWEKSHYKYQRESVGFSILQTEDEGYLINSKIAELWPNGHPGGIWVIKTDPDGNYE